jgi:uncharacterized membrane protein
MPIAGVRLTVEYAYSHRGVAAMNAEFPSNSQPDTMLSDEEIVQDLLPELSSSTGNGYDPEFAIKEQNRLAWERDRARIKDFLDDPLKYFNSFWQQYKPLIITLVAVSLALIAVNFVFSIIGFIVGIPLMEPLLEMIGIGYSIWFTRRYLLKAESRREFSQEINKIKQGIIGTTEEVIGTTEDVVGDMGMNAKKSITIQKSPEELYQFWRNFENLPVIMNHLQAVHVLDDRRSHWVAKAPLDQTVEWDAEIIDEKENQSIVWRSTEGADVDSTGSVTFTNANGSGTEVKVTLKYNPPAGVAGAAVATLFGENPQQQLEEDMQQFKVMMESDFAELAS